MKKNKSVIAFLSIAIVGILSSITLLTGAWFTDTKSAGSATITVGNAVTLETTGTFTDETVMPGSEVEFASVQAKAAANTSEMYVRAYVSINGNASEVLEIVSAGDNWVKYGDFFYYTEQTELTEESTMSQLKALTSGVSTSNLTLTAKVSEEVTEETLVPASTLTCEIIFQAIQTASNSTRTVEAMKDKWGEITLSQEIVFSNNEELGTVDYSLSGNTITLKATANEGAGLVGWKDENGNIIPNAANSEYWMFMSLVYNVLEDATLKEKMSSKFSTPVFDIFFTEEEIAMINTAWNTIKNTDDGFLELMIDTTEANLDKINDMVKTQEVTIESAYSGGTYTALFTAGQYSVSNTVNGLRYLIIEDTDTALVLSSSNQVVDIPAQFNENSVIGFFYVPYSIGDLNTVKSSLFASATSITIPESFTIIQDFSFHDCTNLASVSLPSTLTEIGTNTFANCTALTDITIPNKVTTLGNMCFSNTGLTQVQIPESVTSIKSQAFINCYELQSVAFADNCKINKLAYQVFYGCKKLTSITIPATVTTVREGAFMNCDTLQSINIPANVVIIEEMAFADCSVLGSITFADNSTWYTADDANGTNKSAEPVDVTNASTNASNFNDTSAWRTKYLLKE